MPESLQLAWGASSDRGLRRAVNEDAFLAEAPLFLVADGMGGHEAGAEASRRAIDGFRPLVGLADVTVEQIQEAFRDAVLSVDAIGAERTAPGTTLAGVAVSEHGGVPYWLVLNIGDSRTYRLGEQGFAQISIDHSAVQALVDDGRIGVEEAEVHPQRNVVTRAVIAGSTSVPDYWLLPVSSGDRILICSDGLSKELPREDIHRVLEEEPSAQAAATRLVHEALLRGGRDNVTVVVVDAAVLDVADDAPTAPSAGVTKDLDEDTRPRPVLSEEEHRASL